MAVFLVGTLLEIWAQFVGKPMGSTTLPSNHLPATVWKHVRGKTNTRPNGRVFVPNVHTPALPNFSWLAIVLPDNGWSIESDQRLVGVLSTHTFMKNSSQNNMLDRVLDTNLKVPAPVSELVCPDCGKPGITTESDEKFLKRTIPSSRTRKACRFYGRLDYEIG